MQRVAVYCGANFGSEPSYAAETERLVDELVSQDIGVVYGGSRNGLMGVVADRVVSRGGSVVGVMPVGLIQWEQAHSNLTELITVSGMHERKRLMSEKSDAFVALPGGIGTLEEIFEMISWAQLGVHRKPCALFNIGGYYDKLIEFLDHSVKQGLMRSTIREMIVIETDPEKLVESLKSYESPVKHRMVDSSET